MDEQTKTCTKCLQAKSLSDFSRRGNRRNGINSECKKCVCARARRWAIKNPERYLAKQNAWSKANPGKRKDSQRKYAQTHPEKIRQNAKEWAKENPDKVRVMKRVWEKNNIPKRRRWGREYYQRNKSACLRAASKWVLNNKEKVRLIKTKWSRNNRAKCRIGCVRYRARKAAATGSFTLPEWMEILSGHASCPRCCTPWSEIVKPTIDHIVPLSKGGSNFISNIQPLCRPCNSSKGGRIQMETISLREPFE